MGTTHRSDDEGVLMARKSRRSGGVWSASLGGALLLALSGQPAKAQSLEDALANAYVSNPTIESQRAQLRATDELVPQALSGYRPTVEAGANAGYSRALNRTTSTT